MITTSDLGAWLYSAATVAQLAATITVLVTINSKQRREVTFAGQPVDKAEYDKHYTQCKSIHDQLFAKIGGAERGVETRITSRFDKFEADSIASRRAMHKDIEEMGKEVAALKKRGRTRQPARLPDGFQNRPPHRKGVIA